MCIDQIRKEVVYIDSSVPSAYYDDRVLWRMEYTRKWWHEELVRYHAVISPAVVAEILGTRDEQTKEKLLGLVLDYPQLELSPEIEKIANGYIGQKIIPPNYATDAFHIAVASYYKADFLVTWNCRHLADGHRRKKIKLFNTSAGLYVPEILTPLELTGGEEDVVQ